MARLVRVNGWSAAAGAALLSLALASPAAAQYTGGCTMPGIGPILQESANAALLDACRAHDNCYMACAPDDPGALAAHRDSCDIEFYGRWHGECLLLGGVFAVEYPDASRQVFEICEAAGLAAYVGVVTLGVHPYYSGQCDICCNSNACAHEGWGLPAQCWGCNGNPVCECESTGGRWEISEGGEGRCMYSPLLINLQSNAASDHLTSAENGVRFDIGARGRSPQVAWPRRGAFVAFLALDRNGNGLIDDGSELFGTATRKRDGTLAANGFEALSEFDDNADGRIDHSDGVYARLRLWVDLDHDGRSQPYELLTLEEGEIVALYTTYSESSREDRFGNEYRYRGVALTGTDDEAHRRRMFDVFLTGLPQ
jgi:hypothetical protein